MNSTGDSNNGTEMTSHINETDMTSHIESYDFRIHPVVLTLILVTVCWLLFANTVIVTCFIINRHRVWPTFVSQILCLSLSDLFVGLVAIPWLILPVAKPDDVPVPHVGCSLMLYLLICSQCGSLYHMLTICVHRCFRIETSTKMTSQTQAYRRSPFLLALLAWVASFIVCIFPFIYWTNTSDDNNKLYACILQEIFEDHVKIAMGYMVIVLILPQGLTNVLYLVACLRFRCIWRQIFPVQAMTSSVNTSHTSSVVVSGYSRANIRIQRRFMGTLGIVMLLYNICTLPVICVALLENKFLVTNRNFRFSACAFFIINSALNPFIYALRSSWLKNALKRFLANIHDCFICL